jgi:hypothetical protein
MVAKTLTKNEYLLQKKKKEMQESMNMIEPPQSQQKDLFQQLDPHNPEQQHLTESSPPASRS